jgi:uncharacterized protein
VFGSKIITMDNMDASLNVFGERLISCSEDPLTGFYRNGCCDTGLQDQGNHTVCSVMTQDFLEFSQSKGNDLITPRPMWAFPGLVVGDRWCICVLRWKEAFEAGKAPLVVLEATHENALKYVHINDLIANAFLKTEVFS